MYTVMIQNKKGMEKLQEFYPLFAHAIEAGQMSLCRWDEDGVTVDTALPELYELVSKKRIWRALVVCPECDRPDTLYPADERNPFDYMENRGRDGITVVNGELVDCEAPLIRLTHLLGGIPTPEPIFEPKLVHPVNQVPRMEYHPVENEEIREKRRAHADWMEQHTFQGLLPAEIVLVRVRKPLSNTDAYKQVRGAWKTHTEAESSAFWKRNLYPHNCRFLTYELSQQGMLRHEQEIMRLWLALLLIAKNDIPPDVLQAHRLYKLDVRLNEERLTAFFQDTVNELNTAMYQLQKSMENDRNNRRFAEGEIPDFEVGVPVSFQMDKVSNLPLRKKDYGLTGGASSEDMAHWKEYSGQAREELRQMAHAGERALDHAAERLRARIPYQEQEVELLSAYQEEDLKAALSQEYADVLNTQQKLPANISNIRLQVEDQERRVRAAILQRVSAGQARAAVIAAAVITALCILPGVFSMQSLPVMAAVLLAAAGLPVATCLLVLAERRKNLLSEARQFQREVQLAAGEMHAWAEDYSSFLSGVASLLKGRTYLSMMHKKQTQRDGSFFFRHKHMKGIEILLDRIALWSTALQLKINMDSVSAVRLEEDREVDYDRIYSFPEADVEIPLNNSGNTVDSPFAFIDQLIVEREEAFDDAVGI